MKKVLLALVAIALIAGPAFAGQNVRELVNDTELSIYDRYVDADATVLNCKKVAFFVTNDPTENTHTVTVSATAEISYDGTTWLAAQFKDFAGGTTFQSTQNIDSNGYYFWLDENTIAPYVRIGITLGGTTLPPDSPTSSWDYGHDENASVSVQIIREQ